MRVRVVGLQADGFPVESFRLGAAAGIFQDVPQAVARLGERGAEPDGLAEGRLGFRVAAGVPQDVPKPLWAIARSA